MAKNNQYTGLRQYTGRVKRVTPSVARPIVPRRFVREPRWRRRRRPQRIVRIFASFPITIEAQNCIIVAGGGCGHLHRKNQEKVKKNTCNVWRWCDVLHVGVRAGWCIINRCDGSYLIFNVTPSLLPLGHRVVGSHQQTKHKKAQTNQNTKTKRKTIRKTKERYMYVAGSRYSTQRKRPNMKKAEGRNAWKISTAGGWQISFSVQTGNRRKEGTREKEQQPGGGGDLSANTKNEKHLVGFRTITRRVYWTYVR